MTFIPLTGASSGGSKPSNWTVRERLRNITKALTAGSSLDLRFAEKFFYQNDALYPAMELMATHSRTSSAWYPNWDFKSGSEVGRLVEYGADERRYGDYGALDEGAATNHIRNPRCEGTQTGPLNAGGVLPDHWASAGLVAAEWTFVGSGVEQGWPYAELSYSGSDNAVDIYFEGTTAFGVLTGQSMASSVGVRLVSGSLANTGIAIRSQDLNSGGGQLSVTNTSIAVDTEHRRFAQLRTTAGGGTQTNARFGLQFTNSAAANFTLRIYAPQLEQSATPSSPILPTAGTPAAATRAADVVTGVTTDRASRGWYDTQWDYTDGGLVGDLLEFLPGVPRVGPKGLLVEEGSTNHIRNPRAEGAVAGAPGTLPTNWQVSGLGTGAQEVAGAGHENGWPYVDVRFSGTPSGNITVLFEGNTQVSASTGETWTLACGVKIASGSLSNLSGISLDLVERTGAGGFVTTQTGQTETPLTTHARFVSTATLSGGGTVGVVVPGLKVIWDGSGAIDITLRIYAPQLEQKAYPTSVVLPEAGSPAAATRAKDDPKFDTGAWEKASSGFTIFAELTMLGASDGAIISLGPDNNNRMSIEANGFVFLNSGATTIFNSTFTGDTSAGSLVRVAVAMADGDYALSRSGVSQVTAAGGPAIQYGSGIKLNGAPGGGAALAQGAFIRSLRYFPTRPSNAELEALVA